MLPTNTTHSSISDKLSLARHIIIPCIDTIRYCYLGLNNLLNNIPFKQLNWLPWNLYFLFHSPSSHDLNVFIVTWVSICYDGLTATTTWILNHENNTVLFLLGTLQQLFKYFEQYTFIYLTVQFINNRPNT